MTDIEDYYPAPGDVITVRYAERGADQSVSFHCRVVDVDTNWNDLHVQMVHAYTLTTFCYTTLMGYDRRTRLALFDEQCESLHHGERPLHKGRYVEVAPAGPLEQLAVHEKFDAAEAAGFRFLICTILIMMALPAALTALIFLAAD